MPTVILGNIAPTLVESTGDGLDEFERSPMELPGDQDYVETTFGCPESNGLIENINTILSVFASHHSTENPAWVESTDEQLANALASHFDCPVGRPEGQILGTAGLIPIDDVQQKVEDDNADASQPASVDVDVPDTVEDIDWKDEDDEG